MIDVGGVRGTTIAIGIAIVAVIMGTFVLLSQKELSNTWGASFFDGSGADGQAVRKQEIVDRCELLAKRFG